MIRGKAYTLSTTGARAYMAATATARAVTLGALNASRAISLHPIGGEAERTREAGLFHFLHVRPEQPQEIVWLVPVVGIDYEIETSTDLKWKID